MEIGSCSGIKAGGAFRGRNDKEIHGGEICSYPSCQHRSRSEFGQFWVDTVESGRNLRKGADSERGRASDGKTGTALLKQRLKFSGPPEHPARRPGWIQTPCSSHYII